jgi:hypothetical protein
VTSIAGASASAAGPGATAGGTCALVLARPRFAGGGSAGLAAARGSSSTAVVVLITEILAQLTRCYPAESKMAAPGSDPLLCGLRS